jgi:hypothetical protein
MTTITRGISWTAAAVAWAVLAPVPAAAEAAAKGFCREGVWCVLGGHSVHCKPYDDPQSQKCHAPKGTCVDGKWCVPGGHSIHCKPAADPVSIRLCREKGK